MLWPKLSKVLHDYPDVKVEFVTDYGLTDIVAERYDIGVRLGDTLAKDMIAARIAPDLRMVIVGAPAYLKRHRPKTPQDLTAHRCINLRLPTRGGVYAWELKKGQREIQVRVDGQLTFNGVYEILDAALSGYGLAYMPEDLAQPHVAAGRLAGAGRLVSDLPRLSRLLPEPPAVVARAHAGDRRAARPDLKGACRRRHAARGTPRRHC